MYQQKMELRTKSYVLAECGIMVALGTILSFLQFSGLWAQGGSVTFCAMLPIIIAGYRNGPKWGVLTGVVFGFLQLILGLNALKGNSLWVFVSAVFLDYILAYGVLGFSGFFRGEKYSRKSFMAAVIVVILLRFLCHFLSGIFVWNSYAPESFGKVLYIYSLTYNGSYMLPELIITFVAGFLIYPVVIKDFSKKQGKI